MHPLDHIVKKRLSHAHTPVDGYNWDKIAEKLDALDNQKPKHVFLRSTLGAASIICLLLISGILGFNIYDSTQELPIALKKDATKIDKTSATQNTANLNVNNSANTSKVEQQQISVPANQSITTQSTPITNSSQISTQVISQVTTDDNNIANTIAETTIPNVTGTNSITTSTSINQTDGSVSVLNNDETNVDIQNVGSTSQQNPETRNQSITDIKTAFAAIQLISNKDIVAIGEPDLSKVKSLRKPAKVSQKTVPGCPFSLESNDKSLEVFVSHDIHQQTYSSSRIPADSDLLNLRQESVVGLYSYTVGARFGYNLSNRWRLHLGASYSQQNEKFSYIDPESNQERFVTTVDYIKVNGVTVDSIVTTEKIFIPGTVIIQKNNKYSSFDIPIIARFAIFGNKDLSLSTTIGPVFNVSYHQKGMIIGDDFKPQNLEDYNGFKAQLGARLYGGFSLAYHLTGDMDLVLEPHAKISLKDATKDNTLIQQRNQVFGLHTGLRYRF